MPDRVEQLLAVLLMEALVGYPHALHRRVPHPVVGVGKLISVLERRWNDPRFRGDGGKKAVNEISLRFAGSVLVALLMLLGAALGLGLELLLAGWTGAILIVLIATTGIAQKSLHDHVLAVVRPLCAGRLKEARLALSMIVGRDTHALDEQAIAAAATESLAESLCDGIIAPAFWFLLFGLPGLFVFKAISTADSLIGHLDERHRHFGWASARMDDLLNVIPARISGVLICLAAFRLRSAYPCRCRDTHAAFRIMFRDARKHLSPNAGWAEAAMAGALGVRLGGGAFYGGEWIARAKLGDGPRPSPLDLQNALSLYRWTLLLLWLAVGGLAWAL